MNNACHRATPPYVWIMHSPSHRLATHRIGVSLTMLRRKGSAYVALSANRTFWDRESGLNLSEHPAKKPEVGPRLTDACHSQVLRPASRQRAQFRANLQKPA